MTNIQDKCEKTVRPWGYFINIANGAEYLVKIIHVNPAGQLSVQSHNHREEHWVITYGTAEVLLDNKKYILKSGQNIYIPPKAVHSIINPTNNDLEIIEIQRGKILSEEDIIRYKDIYGRV